MGVRLMLVTVRWFGVGEWTARPLGRKAVTLAVLAVVAATPIVGLLVVLGLLFLAMMTISVLWVVFGRTDWGRSRFIEPRVRSRLRELTESPFTPAPTTQDPFLIRSWGKQLRTLGFEHIVTGQHGDRLVRAIFVQPSVGVMADLLWQPMRIDRLPLPAVNLASVVAGHRGALSTAAMWKLETCPGLITQRVAIASPPHLLALHLKSQRLLEEFGIRFERVTTDGAMEFSTSLWRRIVEHLVTLPMSDLFPRAFELYRARDVGSRLHDPDFFEQVACLREAPEPIEPVGDDRGSVPAGP
jgi:hypothetical protein